MKVTALIERTDNGYYSIACDAQIGNFCLGGYGNSVEEAKADFASIIKEAQEEYIKQNGLPIVKYLNAFMKVEPYCNNECIKAKLKEEIAKYE